MDEQGIDVQVLSHAAPSTQQLNPNQALPLARQAKDSVADAVAAHPGRFGAFATLPTSAAVEAADELAPLCSN